MCGFYLVLFLSSLPCPIEDRQEQVFLLFYILLNSLALGISSCFFCFVVVDVFLVRLSKGRLLFPFFFPPFL
jgi:hypothetical protein